MGPGKKNASVVRDLKARVSILRDGPGMGGGGSVAGWRAGSEIGRSQIMQALLVVMVLFLS